MNQLVLLWEVTFSFSEFFWRLFQPTGPLPDGWFTNAPAHTLLSRQQFLTKNSVTPVPHPSYSPHLAPRDYILFPWMKKVLRGKHLVDVEEVKQKNGRSTKRHQNWKVQKLLWAVEKTSRWVCCIKWRVLWRWRKFKRVRINAQFFINKLWVFWGPPCVWNTVPPQRSMRSIHIFNTNISMINYSYKAKWNSIHCMILFSYTYICNTERRASSTSLIVIFL